MVKMRVKQFKILLGVMALFLSCSNPAVAAVKAYLNQTTVYEGDPITLTIETDKAMAATPDLSALQQQFKVVGSKNETQIRIINGKSSQQRRWVISLQPMVKGDLVIPSLTVGDEHTQAIALKVNPLPESIKVAPKEHIFITSSIGNPERETYVQQQIAYTVKLLYDAVLLSGNMTELEVENAVVTQLGNDKKYSITKAGRQFQVLEKNFVISPEKSGLLKIPALTVTGHIAVSLSAAQPTDPRQDFFNRTRQASKPFSMSSDAIEVNVLPVPKAFTGEIWLPAEALVIQDSWDKNLPKLKVGEPVTRTLTLQAKGLAGSQIPELNVPKPEGMKVYVEKADTDTTTDGKAVYGNQKLNITYIPNQWGTAVIPEMTVDFWHVDRKKQERVTLPARQVNIVPGATSTNESALGEQETEIQRITEPTSTSAEQEETLSVGEVSVDKMVIVKVTAAVLILGLFTYGAYYWRRSGFDKRSLKFEIESLKSSLINACDENNNQAAAMYLIEYTRVVWADEQIQNLRMLASQLDENAAEMVSALEQSLYAKNATQWHGEGLKEWITAGFQPKQIRIEANKDELKPLYPIS